MAEIHQSAEVLPAQVLQDAAAMMALLAATVRLQVLWLLAAADRDVGTLAEATGQTVPTVSHHLSKLKLAGLVNDRRHGRQRIYYIADPRVVDVVRIAIESRLDTPSGQARARHA